jgi:D-alanine-D-alanine ligase
MQRLAVMFGGRSIEHEISVITGLQAIQAIDPKQYAIFPVYLALNGKWYTGRQLLNRSFYQTLPGGYSALTEITLLPDPSLGGFTNRKTQETLPTDLCLLCFHGQYGEDGCVQGLLELADLPYTGGGVLSSALTMSKSHTKDILNAHQIPTLPHVAIHKKDAIQSLEAVRIAILEALSFPLFIKPNHLGSSIGVSKAIDLPSLDRALAKVFQYDSTALIEPYVERLMELNIAVVDNDPPQASVIEIPLASEEALSYEDKYLRSSSKTSGGGSQGMAGLTRVIDPPDLDPALKKEVIALSLKAFQLLNCSGVCRFDFMVDLTSNKLYFNEVNPIPGSLSYYLWDKAAPPILYTELLNKLMNRSAVNKAQQRSLNKNFGFHAL